MNDNLEQRHSVDLLFEAMQPVMAEGADPAYAVLLKIPDAFSRRDCATAWHFVSCFCAKRSAAMARPRRSRSTRAARYPQLVWFLAFTMIAGCRPAAAQQNVVSQVNIGVLAHNVPIIGEQKEHGVDLNGELLFVSPVPDRWLSGVPPIWRWLLQPRPTLGFDANMNGNTSQVYVSLTWTVDLDTGGVLWPDHTVFLGVSFGPAYNTGHVRSRTGNHLSLGSNVLFHPALEIRWRVTPVVSISGKIVAVGRPLGGAKCVPLAGENQAMETEIEEEHISGLHQTHVVDMVRKAVVPHSRNKV